MKEDDFCSGLFAPQSTISVEEAPEDETVTPLQRRLHTLIDLYEKNHGSLSGRELSLRVGKTRNHMSQIMNDGLVPSGEVLMKIAESLETDEQQRSDLILDAMRTKVEERSRDAFWLKHALDLIDVLTAKMGDHRAFLDARGLLRQFDKENPSRHSAEEVVEGD